MRMPEGVSGVIKTYPYAKRLPFAASMLCVIAWIFHTSSPASVSDRVVIAAAIPALFCGHRGRPFWFFWGVAVGAFLLSEFAHLK
jgi:hypothetical protein